MPGRRNYFGTQDILGPEGVDALDVKILRDVIQSGATTPLDPDFRKSFATIAQKLGVDPDTVRNRVRKLHEAGLVGDWHIIVNPHLLGGEDVVVAFDVEPSAKEDLAEKLKLMPGVFVITSFLGSRLVIVLRTDNQYSFEKQLELMRKVSKASFLECARVPYPECRIGLSKTDWAVLRALQRSPRKTYSAVSKDVGQSTRTVKRRLDRMIRGSVAFAFPNVNPKALRGAVMAALEVHYPSDRKADIDANIAELLEDSIWHILHLLPPHSGGLQPCRFNLVLPSISDAKRILDKVEDISGIQSARIDFFEDMVFIFESFDEYLVRKMGQSPLGRVPEAKSDKSTNITRTQ